MGKYVIALPLAAPQVLVEMVGAGECFGGVATRACISRHPILGVDMAFQRIEASKLLGTGTCNDMLSAAALGLPS